MENIILGLVIGNFLGQLTALLINIVGYLKDKRKGEENESKKCKQTRGRNRNQKNEKGEDE